MLAAAAALLGGALSAAPSVEITNVQQQYPWTNTVDITYTVQGVAKTHQTNRLDHIVNDTYFATFEAKQSDGTTAIADENGNTVFTNALVEGNGTFTAQWQPAKNLQLTGCTMTPSVFRGEENAYLVINLETNKQGKMEWWYEPMSTQEASNKRYNTELYKTKYVVLRKIPAGEYTIGAPFYDTTGPGRGANRQHKVQMAKDYYVGIFYVTQAQFLKIMQPELPLSADTYPKNYYSYNDIRGNALPAAESGGIMKVVSDATGLTVDLPTESMMFVASASGLTTPYITGTTTAGLDEYGWMSSNLRADPKKEKRVGLKKPNLWGIYDFIGNCWEWTRDAWNDADLATTLPDGQTPNNSGTMRTTVLGDYSNRNEYQTHAYRAGRNANEVANWSAFRFSVIMN